MYGIGNGVNGYHSIREKEIPYFIQRYDQTNFPKDWEEHEENCRKGIASSTSLTQEQWEVLTSDRRLKEKREKQSEWEIWSSPEGEVCQPVCTDIFRFHLCFSPCIDSSMKCMLIEYSRLYYSGKRVGIEQGLLGQIIGGATRKTISKKLATLLAHEETCPICKQEGFKLLELDEKYDYNLGNKCDSYKLPIIEYTKHLTLHFRELGESKFNEKVDQFRKGRSSKKKETKEPNWPEGMVKFAKKKENVEF